MRYALYYLPDPQSEVFRKGSALLGHDCYTGQAVAPPQLPGLAGEDVAQHVRQARKYGFHATLKPPFTLRDGASEADLLEAARSFCALATPLDAGPMQVAGPGPFVALEPVAPPPALGMMAAEIVAFFDRFRAPLSAADLARRPPEQLAPRQQALQQRWGYPWVFETFRFHMTLSDRLDEERLAQWRGALAAWFGQPPLLLDSLAVLRQNDRDAPFQVIERLIFGG